MGAVSVTVVSKGISNSQRTVDADVTFSASYSTGGDTIAPSQVGLSQIEEAHVIGGKLDPSRSAASFTPNLHGIQPVLAGTPSAPTLKAFKGSNVEVTAATNLSTSGAVRIRLQGR